ncbi:hypothetical protein [Nocardia sp. SC052]
MTELLLTLRESLDCVLHYPIRTLELWEPVYSTPILRIPWGPR